MGTSVCNQCAKGEMHVCPRETRDECEWCSLTPAVKYVRLGDFGGGASEDFITLCNDCRDALRDGLKRAVRTR